ncbi:MAG: succinate dehydrogenase cytochrome b subunit [Candidatus Binatia bacterium]
MEVLSNSVGRKVTMAVTGLVMVLFVIAHLLGNLTIFAGPDAIDAYAAKLHSLGPILWISELVLAVMLGLHVIFGIVLTLENRAAKPERYAVKNMMKATFAGQTMIWTGLLLLAFIVYHLLQFTLRVTPDIVLGHDAKGRIDVFTMVLSSIRVIPIALVYLAAMVALFLHLYHGIQSIFQTISLTNDKARPQYERYGRLLSVLLLLGYCSIPILILAGFGVFAR